MSDNAMKNQYKHLSKKGKITVPRHSKEIKKGTLNSILKMAEDAALGWVLTAIEENEEIPEATDINEIEIKEKEGFKTLQEALLLKIVNYKKK